MSPGHVVVAEGSGRGLLRHTLSDIWLI